MLAFCDCVLGKKEATLQGELQKAHRSSWVLLVISRCDAAVGFLAFRYVDLGGGHSVCTGGLE